MSNNRRTQAETPAPLIIPLARERLKIDRRRVGVARVIVKTTTQSDRVVVDELLRKDDVRIHRLPVSRFIDRPATPRYEGNALVIPVMEEVLVVTKRRSSLLSRSAYFNGDPIRAMKKGFTIIPRIQVAHMAQMQNMFDFPPAPKLMPTGRLDPARATESEKRGEQVFFGKGQCASCHSGPALTDHMHHDLKVERFVNEPPDGPIKTFTLRGIKDSPPYLHDGRLLTLEDTVEFFNLVLGTRLTKEEKADLVAYLRVL